MGLGVTGFNDPASSTALQMIKEEPDDATAERLRESMIAARRVNLNGSLIEKPMKELVIADSSMTDNEDESNRQLKSISKKLLGNRKPQASLTVETKKEVIKSGATTIKNPKAVEQPASPSKAKEPISPRKQAAPQPPAQAVPPLPSAEAAKPKKKAK